MKNIKYLLAALIIAASAVSCADADAAQTADTASAETGSTAAETEDVFDPFANLPEADYDGYEFNMLIRPTDRWVGDMYIEEATGDPVDDAVFERNSRISEQYNIKFT